MRSSTRLAAASAVRPSPCPSTTAPSWASHRPLPEGDHVDLGSSPSPDEVLASVRLSDDVQSALLKLPYDFREAVVLCDVVGLTYEEIADATDVPVGTVRSRIHRGRSMLRGMLTWPV
jgi:RNA polymerase sigma factor (sigma-70 family)